MTNNNYDRYDRGMLKTFLRDYKRMCVSFGGCSECPLNGLNCGLEDPNTWDKLITETEKWAQEHPMPERTLYIPDEIVNEVTFEATYVDKAGVLLTEEGMTERMKLLEGLVKPALPNADSVRCVKIQQFVTKGHEEEC